MPSPSKRVSQEGVRKVPPPSITPAETHSTCFNVALALLCVCGIYGSYSTFGLMQEKIYLIKHPSTGEVFNFGTFLVACIALSSQLMGLVGLLIEHRFSITSIRKQVSSSGILLDFGLIALTYVGAMAASNMALQHVNFPTQVLVKSAKMVPVVIGGYFLFGKKYPWYDYFAVVLITVALVVFNLFKARKPSAHSIDPKDDKSAAETLFGIVLCCISLLCDGLTGPRQDKLTAQHKISQWEHMFFTNSFALIYTTLLTLATDGLAPLRFLQTAPEIASSVIICAVCSGVGQVFIFLTLTSFGALYLSLITTTRKLFSVVLSVMFFGHLLTTVQWGAVAAVFCAIAVQMLFKNKNKLKHHHHHHPHQPPATIPSSELKKIA